MILIIAHETNRIPVGMAVVDFRGSCRLKQGLRKVDAAVDIGSEARKLRTSQPFRFASAEHSITQSRKLSNTQTLKHQISRSVLANGLSLKWHSSESTEPVLNGGFSFRDGG
jgi:hypothetical protein